MDDVSSMSSDPESVIFLSSNTNNKYIHPQEPLPEPNTSISPTPQKPNQRTKSISKKKRKRPQMQHTMLNLSSVQHITNHADNNNNGNNTNYVHRVQPWWIGQKLIIKNKPFGTIRDYNPTTQLTQIWYDTEEFKYDDINLFKITSTNWKPINNNKISLEFIPDNNWVPINFKILERVQVIYDGIYGNGDKYAGYIDAYDPISRRHHIVYGKTSEWIWATRGRVKVFKPKLASYIEELRYKFNKNNIISPPPWDPVPYGLDEVFAIKSKEIEKDRKHIIMRPNPASAAQHAKKRALRLKCAMDLDKINCRNNNYPNALKIKTIEKHPILYNQQMNLSPRHHSLRIFMKNNKIYREFAEQKSHSKLNGYRKRQISLNSRYLTPPTKKLRTDHNSIVDDNDTIFSSNSNCSDSTFRTVQFNDEDDCENTPTNRTTRTILISNRSSSSIPKIAQPFSKPDKIHNVSILSTNIDQKGNNEFETDTSDYSDDDFADDVDHLNGILTFTVKRKNSNKNLNEYTKIKNKCSDRNINDNFNKIHKRKIIKSLYPRKIVLNNKKWKRCHSKADHKYYWTFYDENIKETTKSWDPWGKIGLKAPWMKTKQVWYRFIDPNSKKYYYHNYLTDKSIFKRPDDFISDEEITHDSAEDD